MTKDLINKIDENKLMNDDNKFVHYQKLQRETIGEKSFGVAWNTFWTIYFTSPIWAPVLSYLAKE